MPKAGRFSYRARPTMFRTWNEEKGAYIHRNTVVYEVCEVGRATKEVVAETEDELVAQAAVSTLSAIPREIANGIVAAIATTARNNYIAERRL